MNATLENFLIGIASSFGFLVIIRIFLMNWSLMRRLLMFLSIKCESSTAGREMQPTGLCRPRSSVMRLQSDEEIMPSANATTENDLEAANGSVNGDVPLIGLVELTDLSDKLDKADHIVDEETGVPSITANQRVPLLAKFLNAGAPRWPKHTHMLLHAALTEWQMHSLTVAVFITSKQSSCRQDNYSASLSMICYHA